MPQGWPRRSLASNSSTEHGNPLGKARWAWRCQSDKVRPSRYAHWRVASRGKPYRPESGSPRPMPQRLAAPIQHRGQQGWGCICCCLFRQPGNRLTRPESGAVSVPGSARWECRSAEAVDLAWTRRLEVTGRDLRVDRTCPQQPKLLIRLFPPRIGWSAGGSGGTALREFPRLPTGWRRIQSRSHNAHKQL